MRDPRPPTLPAADGRLLRRFARFLRPHAGWVGVALGSLLLSLPFVLAAPVLIRTAVDGPIRTGDADGLARVTALLLAALAAELLLRGVHQWALQVVGTRVMADLRRAVHGHLLRLSPGFHDRTPTGVLVTRVTNDVEQLNALLTQGVVLSLADLATLVVIAGYLFGTAPGLAAATLATTPAMLVLVARFRPRAREAHRRARAAVAALSAHLHESCAGIATLKALRAEPQAGAEMDRRTGEYLEANLDATRLYATFLPAVELVSAGSVALLLWSGGGDVLAGALTRGDFYAFFLLAIRFFEPIRQLAQRSGLLQSALAGAERIASVLDSVPEVHEPRDLLPPPARRGEVELRGVSFAYRPDAPVLAGVSFRVGPGETVALVGPTGGGKSTALHLCERFYDAGEGAVLVDGEDARRLGLGDLRGRLALAPQDPHLLGATLAEAVGLDGADGRARAAAALRALGAEEWLARLPGGLDAPLSERGANLSAGERQLLSLARALAADTPVLLLDEALSDVDPETERRALTGLRRAARGRTILLVAHRLTTARFADRILVVHRGRVVEEGSHGSLLERDGIYRRLVRLQELER
ncbi:MAG: ABC transporter ATP-binding protein/permease [Planctomycetales bacterium]|nr:ABC transporter ATP-binding protein/permease [Planctomycetales bacterium]